MAEERERNLLAAKRAKSESCPSSSSSCFSRRRSTR
ncbi:hypothetical protein RHECNPAF_12210076 [Rhizobium etli CNPAF512]|nr:hypothetical protein RHECNPAF_12210076 [Rhizobium etli CNPAF512]